MLVALAVLAGPSLGADSAIHFRRALQAQQESNWRRALEEYQACLDLAGDDAAVYHNRALVYAATLDWPRALADAEKAVSMAPREGSYILTLGVILMEQEKPDLPRARALLIDAADLSARAGDTAGFGNACYNLGVLARRGRNFREAVRYFELAMKANPDDGRADAALAAMGVTVKEARE
jgi:tetratricopeptide (TPR) repeat protein